jgi:hypothetical protein
MLGSSQRVFRVLRDGHRKDDYFGKKDIILRMELSNIEPKEGLSQA